MAWELLVLLIACVGSLLGATWRMGQRYRPRHRERETWAHSKGWTYLGEVDAALTDLHHFRPFTNTTTGRNLWVTTGIHRGYPFTLGVFESDNDTKVEGSATSPHDATTAENTSGPATPDRPSGPSYYPWVWMDCPADWEYFVVEIPREANDFRWRAALNHGQFSHAFLPLSQTLSAAPGFTFFIDVGRLGLVATDSLEDHSSLLHQLLDRIAEKSGATSVHEVHAYTDYEQLMSDILDVLADVRSLVTPRA